MEPYASGRLGLDENALTLICCGAASVVYQPRHLECMRVAMPSTTRIRVCLTSSATRLVSGETVTYYADEGVTPDHRVNSAEVAMRALSLVILPCTLNFLASGALGLASTPTLTTLACYPRRVLFFPSMRPTMWDLAKRLGHIDALRSRGQVVVDPRPALVYEFWRRGPGDELVLPGLEETADIVSRWDSDGSSEHKQLWSDREADSGHMKDEQ